jgi:hypothetical protein
MKVAGPVKVRHLARGSMRVGSMVNHLLPDRVPIARWSVNEGPGGELSSESTESWTPLDSSGSERRDENSAPLSVLVRIDTGAAGAAHREARGTEFKDPDAAKTAECAKSPQ